MRFEGTRENLGQNQSYYRYRMGRQGLVRLAAKSVLQRVGARIRRGVVKIAEYGAIFGGAGVDLGLSPAVLYENCFALTRTAWMGVRCARFLNQKGHSGLE